MTMIFYQLEFFHNIEFYQPGDLIMKHVLKEYSTIVFSIFFQTIGF